ncbi:alpha/beta hydrolase [Segetibacter aerophilus]|uniref:Endo-1,4-beta-xylanase n=1 Tax=Segetibacter aerophilus TaxID=670293 RepID=A0A512BG25_9BACT|nr:alpha/beta hydrolase [Segetibacter aerophilus]GEO10916.1 endo-1,4-beta-xylanase [Segetibacter aerophilus]
MSKSYTQFPLAALLATFLLPFTGRSQTKPLVLPLWQNGAPGFESRKNEPEEAKEYWVKNIHNPSIAVYLAPKEKATGAAVVVCPGGGHRLLVYNAEGVEPALFLNSIGVTAIVLKYRLAREENSPYSLDKHLEQDAHRALRLVRSHAKDWNIDTARVGMLGFSAGGETVAAVAYASGSGDLKAADPIDRLNGKPNFQMLIYPGPLGIPDSVGNDAPPTFLLAANNDPCCAEPVVKLIDRYRKAKVPVEAHLYAQGSHGFNMGQRSKLNSLKTWSQRVADWLEDNNILHPGKYKPE